MREGPSADFFYEPELEGAFPLLVVLSHRLEKFFALGGIQPDVRSQAGLLKQAGDPLYVALGKSEPFRREPGGEHLADGNGLAVQEPAVTGHRFQRVAEGMAEVEDRAQ